MIDILVLGIRGFKEEFLESEENDNGYKTGHPVPLSSDTT